MKKLFIFMNVMLCSCVGWLIFTHISYTPAPPEKILSLTPSKPSITGPGAFDLGKSDMPANLSYIYENNVFIPNRGIKEIPADGESGDADGSSSISSKKRYTGSFELAGIFTMNEFKGALITSVGTRRTAGLRAKFYRVDEEIADTGYTLLDVSSSSVRIGNGSDESVLELDHNDKGSNSRRITEVKRQELAAKKASLAFNKTTTKINIPNPPPHIKVGTVPKSSSKRPSAKEIDAIRRKILERMKKNKKKNSNSSQKNSKRSR